MNTDPLKIRSFENALKASSGRDIVGFVDNGMAGGDVSSIIDSLSSTIKAAGKTPILYENFEALGRACVVSRKGTTRCYGAIEFLSSPDHGSAMSEKGTWNYTIFGEDGGVIDVRSNNNYPELHVLPLQRAVDMEIIARSPNASAELPVVKEMTFTTQGQEQLLKQRANSYLALCASVFGIVFVFAMIGIVYHLTSFVASE